ncbi:PEP-CTERM sorting domain-containing protein [Pseudoduganella chitinolytica]|uniref:PEP-CTERM sorting domain-containing protein n=1 Tax=Pseudoduganella chitinolytica TaxID=34070 RepID=A0ABY8BIL7_9BURK|nr:PEP-CTERM sorting domain-containing protein [Pseudoduganella chitinolytica]WEF35775.1 PEP-CTERM sorting domain-containing protein [Pseudoduganella chitinolytica]
MLDKLLPAALMVFTAASASAQTRWDFAYSGFHYQELDIFLPSARIDGSFEGTDVNGDGILQRQELTSFVVDTMEYVNNPDGCVMTSCSLSDFSYGIRSGKLDFASSWTYSDDFNYSVGRIKAGQFSSVVGENGSGEWSESTYLWTDRTTFWINPAPVPEPSSIALLGAGVLVVGVWRRRARAKG